MKYLRVLVMVALVGCAGSTFGGPPNPLTQYKAILTACSTYAKTLTVLAVMNNQGQLSVPAREAIALAIPIATGICEQDQPPTNLRVALIQIEGIITELLIMQEIGEQ